MNLQSQRELVNTREKLRRLEAQYEAVRIDPDQDAYVRELAMESLKRLINQFKEEIARYEARHAVRG